MENFIEAGDVFIGDYNILLGGTRSPRESSVYFNVKKSGLTIGIDTANKLGLKEGNYISFGKTDLGYALFFSDKMKQGFLKIKKRYKGYQLSCCLSGIFREESQNYLGKYIPLKICKLGSDLEISIVHLRKG